MGKPERVSTSTAWSKSARVRVSESLLAPLRGHRTASPSRLCTASMSEATWMAIMRSFHRGSRLVTERPRGDWPVNRPENGMRVRHDALLEQEDVQHLEGLPTLEQQGERLLARQLRGQRQLERGGVHDGQQGDRRSGASPVPTARRRGPDRSRASAAGASPTWPSPGRPAEGRRSSPPRAMRDRSSGPQAGSPPMALSMVTSTSRSRYAE